MAGVELSDYLRLGGESVGFVVVELPVVLSAVHLDGSFNGHGVIAASPFAMGWAIERVGWRRRPVTRSFRIAKIIEHEEHPGGGSMRYGIWSAEWHGGQPQAARFFRFQNAAGARRTPIPD